MKQTHLPLKSDDGRQKQLLKKLGLFEKRDKAKKERSKQLKIVHAMNAGRVRGGHSFH